MSVHSSMLWLPEALELEGVRVEVLHGWEEAQGSYFWTDPATGAQGYEEAPSCYMIHHTAGTVATPVVKDHSGQWSKANVWAGLERAGKLYQTGGGIPSLVFTSAGPARVSSGYGHWPTAELVFDDVRVPWRQTNPDGDRALNRYAWNVETVAAGDGSPIDPGVEEALVIMGALICDRFGWSPWRTIGHLTWSTRKVDPYWQGDEARIVTIQDKVEERMGGTMGTAWEQWVEGLVTAWAEDPIKTRDEFYRLNTMVPPVIEPGNSAATVDYWLGLLDQPGHPEWLGFVGRTWLGAWGR
jgi:hypothetical protein